MERATGKLATTASKTGKSVRGPRLPVNPRVRWTRGLTETEARRPGAVLLSMLIQRANDKGLQMNQVAKEIGVTPGYLGQLRSGLRSTPDASKAFLAGCARFLGIPTVQCALAAAKFTCEDFYASRETMETVDAALKFVQTDSVVGGLMPTSTFVAAPEVRLFIVLLFETATGKRLLSSRASTFVDVLNVK